MKVSFSNNPNPAIDVDEIPGLGPVGTIGQPGDPGQRGEIPTASASTSALLPAVVQKESLGGFGDEDDIRFDDIILPHINLIQGIGELSQIFTPGEIVLGKSLVIHEPANPAKKTAGTPPLSITLVAFKKKQYVEDVKFGTPGNMFSSEDEVAKAGGTLEWNEAQATGKPLYNPLATGLFLVQKPEHLADVDHLSFGNECEGKFYALALWSMKKTSYVAAAKVIYTAKHQGHLRGLPYATFSWTLTTMLKPFKNGNAAHVPVLRPGVKNTPAFAEFVQRVISGD